MTDLHATVLERDEVLRQLEDATNQTWLNKRRRWARLVRAQAEEIDRLRKALEQPEQPNPWRDAVDHELSTLHMVASDDPRESIRRLIDWHCAVQIDPLVSSAAQELIERGRREALEQTEQRYVSLPDGLAKSDAEFWLSKRAEIIGACRVQGLTIVTTVHGVHLMRLGKIEAQTAALEKPEPEQEPVAWLELRILSSGGYASPIKEWHVTQNPSTSNALRKPLYTHPPRREWRSLSEEEIAKCWHDTPWNADLKTRVFAFFHTVEAALRSKNHE
jgi:hypothetical protein